MKQKRNLLAVLAAVLAALLVMLGVFRMISVYGHYRSDMLSYESQHLTSIVSSTARGMELTLSNYAERLESFVERYEFSKAEEDYGASGDVSVMQTLMERRDVVDRNGSYVVSVYDPEGVFLASGSEKYPERGGADELLSEGISVRCSEGEYWFVFTEASERGYIYELSITVSSAFSYHANSARVGQRGYLFMMDGDGDFLCYAGNRSFGVRELSELLSENASLDAEALGELAGLRKTEKDAYSIYSYPWDTGISARRYDNSTLVVAIPLNMSKGTLVLGAALGFREFSSLLTDTLRDVTTVILLEVAGMMVLLGLALWLLTLNRRDRMELAMVKEKAEMTEEINRQQKALEHTERLQQLGIMTGGIVHEFNNLLTPIMGQSMLLLEELAERESSPEFENALEIYEASETAREILQRMSSMSKKNADMRFATIDIVALLKKTAGLAAMAKDPHVQIELHMPEEQVFVAGNEQMLTQAFLNLCINGCQAMKGEGTLTVAAEQEPKNGRSYIRVDVCDSGPGIPEEGFGMLFDPFFTTKGEEGTGLGLAICQKILETHKGTISAANRPEGGAKFSVRLPVTELE